MCDEKESPEMTGELRAFEAALGNLRPSATALDRDRLLFLAGQASVHSTGNFAGPVTWLWPAATASMTGIAALLLAALLLRPDPPVLERVVYVANERTTTASPTSMRARAPEVAAAENAQPEGIWSVRRPWPATDITLASSFSNAAITSPGSCDTPGTILSTQSLDELLDDRQDDHHHRQRSAPRPAAPGANL